MSTGASRCRSWFVGSAGDPLLPLRRHNTADDHGRRDADNAALLANSAGAPHVLAQRHYGLLSARRNLSVLGRLGVIAATKAASRHAGLVGHLGGRERGRRAVADGHHDGAATIAVTNQAPIGGRGAGLDDGALDVAPARTR